MSANVVLSAAEYESTPERGAELVLLHAGYLQSRDKMEGMKAHHVWRPDEWNIHFERSHWLG